MGANRLFSTLGSLLDVLIVSPTVGQTLVWNGTKWANGAGGGGVGSGTVTSVAITVPAGLTVSGSPVTSAGTIAITTALSGILKGTGSGFAAATAGTDYIAPSAIGVTVQGYSASTTILGNSFTGSGAIVLVASPALVGAPTSTTPTAGDNSTRISTTAFVATALAGYAGTSNLTTFSGGTFGTAAASAASAFDASGAATAAQSFAIQRANHTGTQTASTISDFTATAAAAAPVQSVAARTGAVVLVKADVGLGNVDNTSNATERAATRTLTNATISGASNTLSAIGNASLSNSSITIAGSATALGGSITLDTLTGLSTTGIVKRTAANTLTTASVALGSEVSGTLSAANGGFGADVSASSGVPLFATGAATFTGTSGTGSFVRATSPTLVTPALGTPSSVTLTNATGLPLSTGTTGLLPVASGGTNTATPSLVAGTNVTVTGTWPNQTIAASGGGGPVVQTFSNANLTVLPGTTVVAQIGTLSGSRTVTLPSASACTAGLRLILTDSSGSATSSNRFIVVPAGSDTIGYQLTATSNTVVMDMAYGSVELETDGTSKWTIVGGTCLATAKFTSLALSDVTLSTQLNLANQVLLRSAAGVLKLLDPNGQNGIIEQYPTSAGIGTPTAGNTRIANVAGEVNVRDSSGNVSVITGNVLFPGTVKSASYTVATLPSASTAGAGTGAYVTDATSPSFGATVAGGGSTVTPVFSNGTNWIVG